MDDLIRDHSLILDLFTEIILEIFKQLDICDLYQASHTCSKWMVLARDRSLWTTPRIGSSLQDSKGVLNIFKSIGRMEVVESISLHCNLTGPVDDLLHAIGFECHNLRKLSIRGQTLNGQRMGELKLGCLGLQELILEDTKPVDDFLKEIRLQCRRLRRLTLRRQTVKDLSVFSALILRSRELEELILEDTRSLKIGVLLMVSKNDFRCVRRLHLVNCGFRLTITILMYFLLRDNLQILSVEVLPNYDDLVQKLISKNAKSLRQLLVKGTITKELLRIICTCEGLESLSLIADSSILTRENFPVCSPEPPRAGAPVMPSLADWRKYQMKFHFLNILEMEGIKTLQDGVLETVAGHSRQLRRCSITRCEQITNRSIEQILLKCAMLLELKLYEMGRVSCHGLAKFMVKNNITGVEMLSDQICSVGRHRMWTLPNILTSCWGRRNSIKLLPLSALIISFVYLCKRLR